MLRQRWLRLSANKALTWPNAKAKEKWGRQRHGSTAWDARRRHRLLDAYRLSGDPLLLESAKPRMHDPRVDLESGGWDNRIEYAAQEQKYAYRVDTGENLAIQQPLMTINRSP